MKIIEVNENDVENVFEILVNNGSFTQLSQTRFRIDENVEKTIKKIRNSGIEIRVIDGVDDRTVQNET
ncbi:hypothetical protein HYX10_02810 [Candidatus Woesearchaeota archaeon]|nr:hypothetical protein [Candidatus Woesearchaeota archaeon]